MGGRSGGRDAGGAAAIAAFPAARWRFRRGLADMDAKALDGCATLLHLLRDLQQHRGMSSAHLSGDARFAPRLAQKRREIGADIAALESASMQEMQRAHPCFTLDDVSSFRARWSALTEGRNDVGVEHNIAQHGELIARALDWLAHFGEARVVLAIDNLVAAGVARNFCQRLPALAETLGQARALGMRAAVSGTCKPVSRVRLMFLATRGESLLAQALSIGEPMLQSEAANAAVTQMIRVMRCEMLAGKGVAIGTEAYFALATDAIDAVYAWIDACVAAVAAQMGIACPPPCIEAYRGDADDQQDAAT